MHLRTFFVDILTFGFECYVSCFFLYIVFKHVRLIINYDDDDDD